MTMHAQSSENPNNQAFDQMPYLYLVPSMDDMQPYDDPQSIIERFSTQYRSARTRIFQEKKDAYDALPENRKPTTQKGKNRLLEVDPDQVDHERELMRTNVMRQLMIASGVESPVLAQAGLFAQRLHTIEREQQAERDAIDALHDHEEKRTRRSELRNRLSDMMDEHEGHPFIGHLSSLEHTMGSYDKFGDRLVTLRFAGITLLHELVAKRPDNA